VRRLVLAIAVAALAATAGCSGERAPAPPTTTVDREIGADDVVPRFADGVRQASGGVIDEVEADCVAALVVEELGHETVIELAFDEVETSLGVPPELAQAMVKGYAQCLPPEDLIAIGNDR
jgi:hypothetical protein